MSSSRRASSSTTSSSTTTSLGSTGSPASSQHSSPDKDHPPAKIKLRPPDGTSEYVVQASETLESISARFDATPSELVKLNRLPMRMVFPGQKIFVPDKTSGENKSDFAATSPVRESPQKLRKSSNERSLLIPGHIEAVIIPDLHVRDDMLEEAEQPISPPSILEVEGGRLDEECHARFLKINASYVIEDHGTVSGVLLVTPNAIMFDPDVSDELVIKNGADQYGTIIPMENILSAAIYSEIIPRQSRKSSRVEPIPFGAFMGLPTFADKVLVEEDALETGVPESANMSQGDSSADPRESKAVKIIPDSQPLKDAEIVPAVAERSSSSVMLLNEAEMPTAIVPDDHEHAPQRRGSSLSGAEDDVQPEDGMHLFEAAGITNNNNIQPSEKPRSRRASPFRSRISSDKKSGDESNDPPAEGPRQKRGSLGPLRKLSRSLMGRDSSKKSSESSDSADWTSPMDGIFQRTGSIRKSVSPKIKSFVDYSSGLFLANENNDPELTRLQSLNSNSDECSSPLPGESFTTWQLRRGLSREDVLNLASARRQKYGYRSVVTVDDKPELFKSIEDLLPHQRHHQLFLAGAKPLYLCFRVGTPLDKSPRAVIHGPVESYGKKPLRSEYWFAIEREKADKFYGFLLHWRPEAYGAENVDPADLGFMLFDEPDEEMNVHFAKDLRGMAKEWEVIAFDEARRRAFFLDREESVPLPDLHGSSEILTDEICLALVPHLPGRAQGYPWNLIYSTSAHGFSLKTLYRKMQSIDAPTLFIIKDVNQHVFGAIISCALRVAEHFYGTGESLLFTFHPAFKIYNWNGENQYIVRGQLESLAIGSGSGTFGLWLDEDFNHGRTQECSTFDNEPLCPCGDFMVQTVEAWCFY